MFVTQSPLKSSIMKDLPDLSGDFVTHDDDNHPFLKAFSFKAYPDYRFGTLCFEDLADAPFYAYMHPKENCSEITVWVPQHEGRRYSRGRSYFLGGASNDRDDTKAPLGAGCKAIRACDVAGFYDYRKEFESGLRDLSGWVFLVSFWVEIVGEEPLAQGDRVIIQRAGVRQAAVVRDAASSSTDVLVTRTDGVQERVARWYITKEAAKVWYQKVMAWIASTNCAMNIAASNFYIASKRRLVYLRAVIFMMETRALLRSYLVFGQLLYSVNQLNLDWPPGTSIVLDLFSLSSFDLDLIHPECAVTVSYFQKWLALIWAPSFMVLVFWAESLLFMCVFKRRRELSHGGVTQTAAWSRAMAAFMACVAIFQLRIALSPWDCGVCGIDEQCMMDHPPFHCGESLWNWSGASPQWGVMAALSTVFLALIFIGLTLFVITMWVSWLWHLNPQEFKTRLKVFKVTAGQVPWFVSFSDFFADGYRGHGYALRGERSKSPHQAGTVPPSKDSPNSKLVIRTLTPAEPRLSVKGSSLGAAAAAPPNNGSFLSFGWACWTMIHTAFLMCICQFYTRDPIYGATICSISLFIFLSIHNHFKPCRMWVQNLFEMLIFSTVFFLTFSAALSESDEPVKTADDLAAEKGMTKELELETTENTRPHASTGVLGNMQTILLWFTVFVMLLVLFVKVFAPRPSILTAKQVKEADSQRFAARNKAAFVHPNMPPFTFTPPTGSPSPIMMQATPKDQHSRPIQNFHFYPMRLPSEASIAASHDVAFRIAMPDDLSVSGMSDARISGLYGGSDDGSIRYLGMPKQWLHSSEGTPTGSDQGDPLTSPAGLRLVVLDDIHNPVAEGTPPDASSSRVPRRRRVRVHFL